MSYNDQYRPSGFGYLPPATKNIIIVNVIMFLLTVALEKTQQIDLNQYLGLHYVTAPDFRPHQFITYLFMHGSLAHIFFNMFGVYIFGQVLEHTWGAKRFLIFYILTGLGAALMQYVIIHFSIGPLIDSINSVHSHLTRESFETFVQSPEFVKNMPQDFIDQFKSFANEYDMTVQENPDRALSLASRFLLDFKNHFLNEQVVIGASGSLFGLLGAFGMLFPNQMLYLYFFIPVKAKWLVIGYGLLELFSGISNRAGDNVAHFAHIGGLIVGIILVLLWKRKDNKHYY